MVGYRSIHRYFHTFISGYCLVGVLHALAWTNTLWARLCLSVSLVLPRRQATRMVRAVVAKQWKQWSHCWDTLLRNSDLGW
jgi:hypothetical protein